MNHEASDLQSFYSFLQDYEGLFHALMCYYTGDMGIVIITSHDNKKTNITIVGSSLLGNKINFV